MSEMTPLPWMLYKDEPILFDEKEGIIADFVGLRKPTQKDWDNVRYAQKACNAFPKLVEALEEALKHILWINNSTEVPGVTDKAMEALAAAKVGKP